MGPYYDIASFHNHRTPGSESLLTDLRDPRLPDHIARQDHLTLPSLLCLAALMFAGLLLTDNDVASPQPDLSAVTVPADS